MLPKNGSRFLDIYEDSLTPIQISWFIKAYLMELIPRDILVKSILEYTDAAKNLEAMSLFVKGEGDNPANRWNMTWLFGDEFCREMEEKGNPYMLEHTREGKLVRELYWEIAMMVVDEELRRGDSETPCSGFVKGVTYILGIQYLARILIALGKDKLDRSLYDSRHSDSGGGIHAKQENLSWLLLSCRPAEREGANELRQALKGTGVDELRLVETAILNLSANAGYSDATRLVLNMDARLGERLKAYLEWRRIGNFQVRL